MLALGNVNISQSGGYQKINNTAKEMSQFFHGMAGIYSITYFIS